MTETPVDPPDETPVGGPGGPTPPDVPTNDPPGQAKNDAWTHRILQRVQDSLPNASSFTVITSPDGDATAEVVMPDDMKVRWNVGKDNNPKEGDLAASVSETFEAAEADHAAKKAAQQALKDQKRDELRQRHPRL